MTLQKENLLFQKETRAGMQSLANQISQVAATVNRLDNQYNKLLAEPEHQVRNVSVVSYLGPFESPYFMTEKEFDEVFGLDDVSDEEEFETLPTILEQVRMAQPKQSDFNANTLAAPFPSRLLRLERSEDKNEEISSFNCSFF